MQTLIKKLDSPLGIIGIILMMTAPILLHSIGNILYQISAERTPHAHWYMLKANGTHWELTPADTRAERRNADAWIKPPPIILTWKKAARHTLRLHNIRYPITVITIMGNQAQEVTNINPATQGNGTAWTHTTPKTQYVAIIPTPKKHAIQQGQIVQLTRRHTDVWDY